MTTKAQEAFKLLQRPEGCTNAELAKVLGRSRANVKGYARRRWKLPMTVVKAETRYTAAGKPGDLVVPPRKRKSKAVAKPVEAKAPKPEKRAVVGKKASKAKTLGESVGEAVTKLLTSPKAGSVAARKAAKDGKALKGVPASLRLKPIAKQEKATA